MQSMKPLLVAPFILALAGPPVRASDPMGVYALVDKVVFEPDEKAPERIQVWGAFSLAHRADRNTYDPPVRGYLYFRLPAEKAETARTEWADLRKLAGKGECVGLGTRYARNKGKIEVRKAGVKPADPAEYPLGFGLTKMSRVTSYPPVRDLKLLPAAESPADGSEARAGKVTLVARNLADEARGKARYVFEIERAGGEREESPALEPGEKETRWTPRMELKPGESYTWKVRAVDGDWRGPVASAEIRVRAGVEAKA